MTRIMRCKFVDPHDSFSRCEHKFEVAEAESARCPMCGADYTHLIELQMYIMRSGQQLIDDKAKGYPVEYMDQRLIVIDDPEWSDEPCLSQDGKEPYADIIPEENYKVILQEGDSI